MIKIKADGHEYELSEDRVLTNNVFFSDEYNPWNIRPFLIGNEYGPVCLSWGESLQDALDAMIDGGLGDCFLVDAEDDVDPEDISYLGNASEPADLSQAWSREVDIMKQEIAVIIKFAEARGNASGKLSEL